MDGWVDGPRNECWSMGTLFFEIVDDSDVIDKIVSVDKVFSIIRDQLFLSLVVTLFD